MARQTADPPIHCPACRERLGRICLGDRIGRYFQPRPGTRVQPCEDGTSQLTCPRCGERTVLRWGRVAA